MTSSLLYLQTEINNPTLKTQQYLSKSREKNYVYIYQFQKNLVKIDKK